MYHGHFQFERYRQSEHNKLDDKLDKLEEKLIKEQFGPEKIDWVFVFFIVLGFTCIFLGLFFSK